VSLVYTADKSDAETATPPPLNRLGSVTLKGNKDDEVVCYCCRCLGSRNIGASDDARPTFSTGWRDHASPNGLRRGQGHGQRCLPVQSRNAAGAPSDPQVCTIFRRRLRSVAQRCEARFCQGRGGAGLLFALITWSGQGKVSHCHHIRRDEQRYFDVQRLTARCKYPAMPACASRTCFSGVLRNEDCSDRSSL
jgi:hypothetical protein